MEAFEQAIRATATDHAPWCVVPADNKWFTRLVVAAAIVEAVEKLDLSYPQSVLRSGRIWPKRARSWRARRSKPGVFMTKALAACGPPTWLTHNPRTVPPGSCCGWGKSVNAHRSDRGHDRQTASGGGIIRARDCAERQKLHPRRQ